jgi:hypothetical protein
MEFRQKKNMLVYTMKCGYFERAKQVATALNRTIAALKA